MFNIANILANTSVCLAESSNTSCAGWVFEEPVCPEEIL